MSRNAWKIYPSTPRKKQSAESLIWWSCDNSNARTMITNIPKVDSKGKGISTLDLKLTFKGIYQILEANYVTCLTIIFIFLYYTFILFLATKQLLVIFVISCFKFKGILFISKFAPQSLVEPSLPSRGLSCIKHLLDIFRS